MTAPTLDDLKILTQWDTPTICNALEIVVPERRGYGFSVKPFSCLYPDMAPICGYARTAKIRAAVPDLGSNPSRVPYYEYVAAGPHPTIVVIEDLDPSPGIGAFWGEVHTAVHKGLGALGVVTSGSYRDLPDSAPGFQVLGGMVGPSHAFCHEVEFGTSVNVHGMEVSHGDVIHADRHGAVVVPESAVQEIPEAVDLIARREAKILHAARAEGFGIEALKKALSEASEIH
ncbi:RraA family protein [Pelagibius sp. Alg239-R121]|uniref:RraA family protein n=1 Tax=Pelagibius sp. Alg239-R121 TaxID=2993448 RepID=UPI0024A63D99|nr:RraA family protein [Pelagibius sp. Alg239-R121]